MDEKWVSRRSLLASAGMAVGASRLLDFETAVAATAVPPTVYEVQKFGAVGDGTTDDTAAVQAAIDAAHGAGGGTVAFHAGTFMLSRELTLQSLIVLRGAGVGATVLKKAAGAFPLVKGAGFDDLTGREVHGGITRWSLQELTLDGNRSSGALGDGVLVYGYGYSLLNVVVRGCSGWGLWSEYNRLGNDDAECTLVNVKVEHCSGGGIHWQGPHDSLWVNLVAALCGPAGATSGPTTSGVEIKPPGAGLQVTNGHVWGLNHRYGWYVDCHGVSLLNCMGEGAEEAQVVAAGNDLSVVGGQYFAVRPPDDDTVGIQIGTPARPIAGTFLNTRINGCTRGALRFANDAGVGRYVVTTWQTRGSFVAEDGGPPHPNNHFDLQVNGGAEYGDLGTHTPITLAPPRERSSGWAIADAERRLLREKATPAEVREVLATLIAELRRLGLLRD